MKHSPGAWTPALHFKPDRRQSEISRIVNDILSSGLTPAEEDRALFDACFRKCYDRQCAIREIEDQRAINRWISAKRGMHRRMIDMESR